MGAVSVLRSMKGFIRRSWVGEGPVSSLDLLRGQKVTELDKAAASRGFPGSVNNTAKGRGVTIQKSQRGVEQIWFKLLWERKCLQPF